MLAHLIGVRDQVEDYLRRHQLTAVPPGALDSVSAPLWLIAAGAIGRPGFP
jgi:hypothetical protein